MSMGEGEQKNKETKRTLLGLAAEINNMTETEKLLYLKKIVLGELEGKNRSRFLSTITKRMLVCDGLASNIVLNEYWFF